MTERTNDDLCTPVWLLDIVRCLGPIALDPCSNPFSTVNAIVNVTRGQDGLSKPWCDLVPPGMSVRLVFVNPPYSNPLPWAKRCVEAAGHGLEVVGLWKLDPSTKWSAVLRSFPGAVCDLHKRVRFEGGAHSAGKMASTLTYFGPRPYLFCHVFQDVGEVRIR